MTRKLWLTLLWNFGRHAFVIATGFTALLHSTWTLATLFNGYEPPDQVSLTWLFWAIPAFVFALSVDVGQIATSIEIRNGERTRAKYATFAVLAVATYYLQWWYMAAHMPKVALSTGVATSYLASATSLRDFALWIVPGMLPLSTFLYTFSFNKVKRSREAFHASVPPLTVERPSVPDTGQVVPALEPGTVLDDPRGTAVKLLLEQPDLRTVSLTKLEQLYPGISRSTWRRAKQDVEQS